MIVTVYSMTGFGRSKTVEDGYEILVEIKSVNHRYFEYSSRIARPFQFLDEKVKQLCKQSIARGKVEVGVSISDNSENSVTLELNEAYANAYIAALKKLSEKYKLKNDLKLSSVVNNSELFTVKKSETDEERLTGLVCRTVTDAIDSFNTMRAAEGEKLATDVTERAGYILERVAEVEKRSPETVKEYRERLENKIKELLGDTNVDEQRLLTETAIFADKIAVAEETVRLRSHISALLSLFDTGGDIGKKLDFIVQEMNRETNTIGSKAQDIEIGKIVVDIKSEIEKIREQIQNIE